MSSLHILGATGAVGSFLIARLRAAATDAVAYSRQSIGSSVECGSISWRVLDLWRDTQASAATTIISVGPLDALVHWLATIDTPQLKRLIAISSMSIDFKRDSLNPSERDIAQSLHQSETRLRAICAQRGIAWTILRPTLIWGAGVDRSLTPLYRLGCRVGVVPMPLSAGGLRQPIHADDVAIACIAALGNDSSIAQVIPIGGGEQLTARLMWSRVIAAADARAVRLPSAWISAASHLLGTRGALLRATLQRWQQTQISDNSAARLLLGWHPRGFAPTREDFQLRQDAF